MRNQIVRFLIVEAADIAAAAGLFQDHPHITIFPGDGIDVMPVVTGPPEELKQKEMVDGRKKRE